MTRSAITKFYTHGGVKMGFFDSNNDESSSPANDAVNQQIAMNERELEQKRQSLYSQRLEIEKAQGGQNWGTRNAVPTAATPRPVYGKSPDIIGMFGDRFINAAIGQARTGMAGKQPTIS
jgi:hypothetical protein